MIKYIKEIYQEYKLLSKYLKELQISNLKEGISLVNFLFIIVSVEPILALFSLDWVSVMSLLSLILLFAVWVIFKYWIYEFSKEIERKVNNGYKLPELGD